MVLIQTFYRILSHGITSGVIVISPKQIWRYPVRGLTVDSASSRADIRRISVTDSSQNVQTWIPAYDHCCHLHSPTKVRTGLVTYNTAS